MKLTISTQAGVTTITAEDGDQVITITLGTAGQTPTVTTQRRPAAARE